MCLECGLYSYQSVVIPLKPYSWRAGFIRFIEGLRNIRMHLFVEEIRAYRGIMTQTHLCLQV
jgi:hypothetical protein